jgi:arabinofuranosyltransferase
VLVGIGVLSRYRYFNYCLHDDAFISFRYARNLVRGDGLVMNPGERVEGVTNFLWTLLAAPIFVLELDPAQVAQIAGAILSLLLVLALFLYGERRIGRGWHSLIAPTFLVGNMAFVMESLSGLETMAFTLVLFATFVAFLEERRASRLRPGLWAALCAAATLLRPEGMLLFGVLFAWSVWGVLRGEPVRKLTRAALLFTLLVLPLFVWRYLYYDSWLPNTFYTKVGYTLAQVERGWRYTVYAFAFGMTRPFLIAAAALTLLALLPLRAIVLRLARLETPRAAGSETRLFPARPRAEALALALLLSATYVLYVTVVGGDYEPTLRFYMPVLPLLYLLFQEAMRGVTAVAGSSRRRRAIGTAIALLGFASTFVASEERFLKMLNRRGWPYTRMEHHRELRFVGEWLRYNTRPRSLIAVSSIGALPYFAERPIVDMMGLTDAHIGRRRMEQMGQGAAGHEKGDGAYVLARRPDVILFDKGHLFDHEASLEEVLSGARGVSELEIAQNREFLQRYDLRRIATPAGVLHYFVIREAR